MPVEVAQRPVPPGEASEAERIATTRTLQAVAGVLLVKDAEPGRGPYVWAWLFSEGVGMTLKRDVSADDGVDEVALATVDLLKAGLVNIDWDGDDEVLPLDDGLSVNASLWAEAAGGVDTGAVGPAFLLALGVGVELDRRYGLQLAGFGGATAGLLERANGSVNVRTAGVLGLVSVSPWPDAVVDGELALGGGGMWALSEGGSGDLGDTGDTALVGVVAARLRVLVRASEGLHVFASATALVAVPALDIATGATGVARAFEPLVMIGVGARWRP